MKKLLAGASLLPFLCAGVAAHAADANSNEVSEVIVTGTRQVGVKAEDSAAPIQVVGARNLTLTGRHRVGAVAGDQRAVAEHPGQRRRRRGGQHPGGPARRQPQRHPGPRRRQASPRHREPRGRRRQPVLRRRDRRPQLHPDRRHRPRRSADRRRRRPVRLRRHRRRHQHHHQEGHDRYAGYHRRPVLRWSRCKRTRRDRIDLAQQGLRHRRQGLSERHPGKPLSQLQRSGLRRLALPERRLLTQERPDLAQLERHQVSRLSVRKSAQRRPAVQHLQRFRQRWLQARARG